MLDASVTCLNDTHLASCLKFFSLCVLQKVCFLQHSADSVQESMGPSNDVQKHDTVIVFKILPRCVTNPQPLTYDHLCYSIGHWVWVWPLSLCRWRGAGSGGRGRKRPQTDFTARKEDLGEIRVRHTKFLWFVLDETHTQRLYITVTVFIVYCISVCTVHNSS